MEKLKLVLRLLKNRNSLSQGYFIPEGWNTWGFTDYRTETARPGEQRIDPYAFFSACIEQILLKAAANRDVREREGKPFLTSVNSANTAQHMCFQCSPQKLPSPCRHSIYCMLPRMVTAWDHYDKDRICSGTFIKALCLLPWLKSIGVDIVSLLPFFEHSNRYKKGAIGSPYAIKNIYKIDRSLHEPLLGEYSEELLDIQFMAFVEACHALGMMVMMDYAFRTAARDNDLILSHPEWFYWIDKKYAKTITTPSIGITTEPVQVNDQTFSALYHSEGLKDYLGKFVHNPKKTNAKKWESLVARHRKTGENILDLIEQEFNMTTVPGFSDVLNDNQPKWTDVTYFRFYFDVNEKAARYVDAHQAPYIMQDGVKLKLYPGTQPNTGLYDYISGVIPYYRDKYGVDGARLDMGHALPQDLSREIITRAMNGDKYFLFWSEEFDPEKAVAAKEEGFHFITGEVWGIYKELEKPGFNKKLLGQCLLKSELPVVATLETPDTPRAAWVHRDKRKLEQLILLNCFLPNSVQFLTNGFEVMEKQPMNLGLDNSEKGRYVLNPDDPMYGKLAFFDPYRLHWTNEDRVWMCEQLNRAARIRKRYLDLLAARENFIEKTLCQDEELTLLYYFHEMSGRGVFLLANRNFRASVRFRPIDCFQQEAKKLRVNLVFRDSQWIASIDQENISRQTNAVINEGDEGYGFFTWGRELKPGEVIIGEVFYDEEER
ncbi:MAG: alpha amylase [Clostridiaceae bacterium]|nr:alpha amylase [Clostridiaceae bacterium]